MTRRNASLQKIRAATMPRDSFHFSFPTFFPHNIIIIIIMHARMGGEGGDRRGEERRVILVVDGGGGDVGRFLTNILAAAAAAAAAAEGGERRSGESKDGGDELRLPGEIDDDVGPERRMGFTMLAIHAGVSQVRTHLPHDKISPIKWNLLAFISECMGYFHETGRGRGGQATPDRVPWYMP